MLVPEPCSSRQEYADRHVTKTAILFSHYQCYCLLMLLLSVLLSIVVVVVVVVVALLLVVVVGNSSRCCLYCNQYVQYLCLTCWSHSNKQTV